MHLLNPGRYMKHSHLNSKRKRIIKLFIFSELPGNFINSLMNYAKQDVDFMAESLNPKHPKNIEKYGNEIFSDQYGLVKKYPKRWNFGIPPNDTEIYWILHFYNITEILIKKENRF